LFGDGIMPKIDLSITMEREANNKDDRVKMNLSGKFLPYKYYDNEHGVPGYGSEEG
jgi:cyanate lyase